MTTLKCAKSINVRAKVKLSLCLRTSPKICGGNGNITSSILRLNKEEWGVSSTLVTLPTTERDLDWTADAWDSKLIWTWCQWVFSNLFSFHKQHFRPNMQPKHIIPGHELRGCSWFSEGLQQNILNLFCKKYIMAKTYHQ